MTKIISFIKSFKRYLKSTYWLFRLIYRNRNKRIGSVIKRDIGLFENVHILCPGGSLDHILGAKIEKNSLIICVNHAINICDIKSLDGFTKIAFTADIPRAKEIINKGNNKLDQCIPILYPILLFSLNQEVLDNYKYIFNIWPSFDKKLGLIADAFKNFEQIKPPNTVFRHFGYGSLNAALIFSLIFEPKQINFWGCDFYSSKEKLYFESTGGQKYAYDVDFSFYEKKIKKDFNLIKKHFNYLDIEFTFH